jgi:hypothetical protein
MKYFKIASFCLLVSACKSEKEKQLVGKWEAAKLVECEANVAFQTELVNIEFKLNGQYVFNSTLNVHEEGSFHLEQDYLLMQDKIKPNATEKVVLIKHLTHDTLVLEMNYKGKEQFLTLKKDVQEPVIVQNSSSKETIKDTSKSSNSTISVKNTEGVAPVVVPVSLPTVASTSKSEPAKPIEVKKETENISEAEAYRRREAKRREEIADKERDEKDKRTAYLEREKNREKQELERKRRVLEREKERDQYIREAYLKREAQRKKEAAARKRG